MNHVQSSLLLSFFSLSSIFQQMLNVKLVKYLNAISQVYHAHFNTCINTWSKWHIHTHVYIWQRPTHKYSVLTAYKGTWNSNFKKCTPTLKIFSTQYCGNKNTFQYLDFGCSLLLLMLFFQLMLFWYTVKLSINTFIWNSKSNSQLLLPLPQILYELCESSTLYVYFQYERKWDTSQHILYRHRHRHTHFNMYNIN